MDTLGYIGIAVFIIGIIYFIWRNKGKSNGETNTPPVGVPEPTPKPEPPKEEPPVITPEPEEPEEEPETPPVVEPEPVEENIIVELNTNPDVDNSANLRIFKEDNVIYEIYEGEYFATGIVEGDPVNHSKVQTAKHGVVRIEGRNHLTLNGNGAILYNLEPAVPLKNPVTGENYPNNGQHASQRKIFYIIDSNYITISDIGGRSNNVVERELGRPQYSRRYEFEHLVDVRNSHHIVLQNMYGRGLWGDGIYINNSNNIFVKNVVIDWNGRQGGAIIAGTKLYVERYRVKNSNRSGFDIEGNLGKDDCEDVVICYSLFNTHLVGFPMGGPGLVKNFLAINNELSATPIWSKGDGVERFRENIMYVNTKARDLGTFDYTNNILIDGIEQDGMWFNETYIGTFNFCTNITIRNCKIKTYGWRGYSSEPFALVIGNNPASEYKVYDNDVRIGVIDTTEEPINYEEMNPEYYYQIVSNNLGESGSSNDVKPYFEEYYKSAIARGAIGKLKDGEYLTARKIHFPDQGISAKEKVSIPFETNEYIEMQWNRLYKGSWRDEEYIDDGWKPEWYNKTK